jgi:hypothetical protein
MHQRWIRLTMLVISAVMAGLLTGAQAADTGHQMEQAHSYIPKNGFIPDEQIAIAIAEAVLVPIYGKQTIEKQKPFVVKLSGDVWTVTGSLPNGQLGGVFLIQISKRTAEVIRVSHSK